MSDAITKALAAAAQEVAQTPPPAAPAPPPAPVGPPPAGLPPAGLPPAGLPPAGLPAGGGSRSLTDFMANAALNVEVYLAVSELGIRLGKDKHLHEAIDVEMCLRHAKSGWVLRVNTPGGVRYLTTYDGLVEQRSRQNWAAVVAQAQQMDAGAYVSDLVEMPAKLLRDYARKEGGPLPAGTVVGLSLSYQNGKAFSGFLQEAHPRFGLDTPFRVRLTAQSKLGSGKEYGIFAYEILGPAGTGTGNGATKAGGRKAA